MEVIRRPGSGAGAGTPAPTPTPTPTPTAASPAPSPAGRGPPRARPSGPPRPPPSAEAIEALARKERVPARIAKGDLEGKMKARIWRKLHAEEAARFDQAYALMSQHPGLQLADAFGVVQSGMSVEQFLARRARVKQRAEVKEARRTVSTEVIDAWVQARVDAKDELAVVFAERTGLDQLTQVETVAFQFARQGRLEKLQVVVLGRRASWERRLQSLVRDPKLAQKPVPVSRQPEKRPVADPRPFAERVGQTLVLTLRNGIQLEEPIIAVGAFDLLVGLEGDELLVPLHALLRFGP